MAHYINFEQLGDLTSGKIFIDNSEHLMAGLADALCQARKMRINSGYDSNGIPFPPLAPFTIKLKGGDATILQETGAMKDALSWWQEGKKSANIGFGSRGQDTGSKFKAYWASKGRLWGRSWPYTYRPQRDFFSWGSKDISITTEVITWWWKQCASGDSFTQRKPQLSIGAPV